MSTTKTRYDYATALAVAEELKELLAPACERIEIAGSLRRKLPDVGDIELLCIPEPSISFWVSVQTDELDGTIRAYMDDGLLAIRRAVNGRGTYGLYNKLLVHLPSGIPVDIFSTTLVNWGMSLVVRTGSAQFNKRMMSRFIQLGKHGHAYPTKGHGGYTDNQGQERDCPEEMDVFNALVWPYIEPENRD